jgi:adenylylsulfate kinase
VDPEDDWLLDGTFYQPEWQERFRALGARFVLVTASLETCLERNRTRADPIDERGLRVVHREFVDPWPDLRLDTNELGVHDAVDRLVAAVASWS